MMKGVQLGLATDQGIRARDRHWAAICFGAAQFLSRRGHMERDGCPPE
jgi:hypothetical protein